MSAAATLTPAEPSAAASRLPSERFLDAWLSGTLALPVSKCSSEQLYRAFRHWCATIGERWPEMQSTFNAVANCRQDLSLKVVSYDRYQAIRVWVPAVADSESCPSTCLERFEVALAHYLRQPITVGLDVLLNEMVFGAATAPAHVVTQAAADALLKRARSGIATSIVLQGHVGDTVDFWQGYAKGVRNLLDGSGAKLAAKDAASSEGYQVPGLLQSAVDALGHDIERLSRREIAKVLAKGGVKITPDVVAHLDVVAAHQLEDAAVAATDLYGKHPALGVVEDDGAGLHAASVGHAKAHFDRATALYEAAKLAYNDAVRRSLRPVVEGGAA